MQLRRVLFPVSRLANECHQGGHAPPGNGYRASQLRIDVPMPGVFPFPAHAGAQEAAGHPNLKLPGLSRQEQERTHD
jgi:hypothetical protein